MKISAEGRWKLKRNAHTKSAFDVSFGGVIRHECAIKARFPFRNSCASLRCFRYCCSCRSPRLRFALRYPRQSAGVNRKGARSRKNKGVEQGTFIFTGNVPYIALFKYCNTRKQEAARLRRSGRFSIIRHAKHRGECRWCFDQEKTYHSTTRRRRAPFKSSSDRKKREYPRYSLFFGAGKRT